MYHDQAKHLREFMKHKNPNQGESMDQTTNQPTNQATNQATSQATSQATNQATNQATSQPTNQPADQAKRLTRTVAVSSGKGGVGKTSLVVNLALALAELNYKVTILDGDLGMANVDVAFGVTPYYNFQHLLAGEKTIREILCSVHPAIQVLPGGSGLAELANLDSEHLKVMLENFKQLEDMCDILLIDTGAGLSRTVINFACAADDLLVTLTSDPTSMTDAYGLLKTLKQEMKMPDIHIVVNRVCDEAEALQAFERLSMAASKFLSLKLQLMGWIYDDPKLGHSIKMQQPVGIAYPQSPAYRCVQWIAGKIVGVYLNPPIRSGGIKGFIRSLLGAS